MTAAIVGLVAVTVDGSAGSPYSTPGRERAPVGTDCTVGPGRKEHIDVTTTRGRYKVADWRIRPEQLGRAELDNEPTGSVRRFEFGGAAGTSIAINARKIDSDHWEVFPRRVGSDDLADLVSRPMVYRDRYQRAVDQPVADVGDQAVESSGAEVSR